MSYRIPIFLPVFLTLLVCSIHAPAEADGPGQKRWSGRVELGLIGIATTSQVTGIDPDDFPGVSDSFAIIDSLDANHSYEHLITSFFLFDINYLLNDTTSLYVGTPFYDDDREGLTAGFQKLYSDNSLLDISLFIGSDSLWEDPYLTGEKRKVTEAGSIGFIIDYDGVSGTGIHLNYMVQGRGVKDDVIGDSNSLLKRSGITHTVKAGYNYFLSDHFDNVLSPTLILIRDDREGDAYANTGFGIELSYTLDRPKNAFSLSGKATSHRYDETHPIFNKRASKADYTIECFYTRKHLWNTNWYTRVGFGMNHIDSNIGFYDESNILYGISLGYSFE